MTTQIEIDENFAQSLVDNGDFVSVPAWNIEYALVTGCRPPSYGSDKAIEVLLQTEPDGKESWFHLEPGQYEVL